MNILDRLFHKTELPFIPPEPPEFNSDTVSQNIQSEEILPVKFNLKLLIISDTHEHMFIDPNLHLLSEPVDACLLLGDISPKELKYIKETVKAPIYGVLGNHNEFYNYEKNGIENIHGKVVEVKGVRIAGIQGSIKYKNANMPLYTDEESVDIANSMEAADILISHDSPKYLHGRHNIAHSGLQGITHYIEKHNALNIHGHYHENKIYTPLNGNKSVCVYGVKILEV